MAANGTKQLSLSGVDSIKRRRYRRCKSAPQTELLPSEMNVMKSLTYPESMFAKPHPNFLKLGVYLVMYLGAGTVCFYCVKSQLKGKKTNGVVDSVYFCIVTMTTVGYGDIVPNSVLAKLLACAYVFAGMSLGGFMITKAADYLVEKQEILLIKALYKHQKMGPTDMIKEVETNRLRYKCLLKFILMFVFVIAGTVFLVVVEKMSFVDAFYCVCSTITTLGYGDQSFTTEGGRVFGIFWILSSTISVAQFFLSVAELKTEKRQKKLVKWVLNRRMTNVDLEVADIDDDGVVDAAEFIIYKLREIGKISTEDISLLMKEFEELDVDQSGTISASDITLAQDAQTSKT